MQMEEDKNNYDNDRKIIVRTSIMIVYEKINAKIFGLHEICKILYLAVSNMENDKNVVNPTYQKWFSRMDQLKKIGLCARVDPNSPSSTIPTTKLFKSLTYFSIFLEHVEDKWIELKGELENF